MNIRDQIIAEARTWIGTPFKHQGRLKGVGVDCAGLLVCVYRECGFDVADTLEYHRSPNPPKMKEAILANAYNIEVGDAECGDFYWMTFVKDPQHLAIISDIGVIHATQQIGKVVEHRLDEKWRRRIMQAFRVRGL